MPDQKISADAIVTQLTTAMYVPVVDPSESDATLRNKRFTLAQLWGASTTFTATSYTYGAGGEAGSQLFIFKGTSQSTFTLPYGSTDIVNMPICFVNLGSADLYVQGAGSPSETINSGGDPLLIANGDNKMYIFKWSGATDGWVVM